jgi:putative peptidoglycan lipid II flippase
VSAGSGPVSTIGGRQLTGGIAAAAGLIAGITLLARVTGFARWLVFSGNVGTTCAGTVYNAANTLPNVLYEVAAGGALAAVAVPLIARQLGRGEDARADRTASALLTWAVTLLVPLGLALALLAVPISRLLLQGPQCAGAQELGATMIRVFAPQVPLYGIGIVLAGVLQAHRRFLSATLAPLLSSLVVIGAYLVYGALAQGQGDDLGSLPANATRALSVGTTLGVVALSLPLLVPVTRAGVRLRPTWRFPDGLARRAGSLASAGLLALVAQQSAVMVAVWLAANRGATGTLNVYQYIQAVYLLPYAVLAVPVAVSAFPALATGAGEHEPTSSTSPTAARTATSTSSTPSEPSAAARDAQAPDAQAPDAQQRAAGTLARSARVVSVAMGLGAAVLVAAAVPVGAFFGRLDAGRTHPGGAEALASMPTGLVSFAPGLIGFGLVALLTRALYVRGRPGHAGRWVAAGWLVAGLVPLLVLGGGADSRATLVALGVCSSLGMTLAAGGLLVSVRSAWGSAAVEGLRRSLAVAVLVAVLAGGAGLLLAQRLPTSSLATSVLAGVLTAALAAGLYTAGVLALDRDTGRMLVTRLRRGRG